MCYALEYDEKPDYSKIKFTLQKELLDKNRVPGGRYYNKRRIDTRNIPEDLIPSENDVPEEEASVNRVKFVVNP